MSTPRHRRDRPRLRFAVGLVGVSLALASASALTVPASVASTGSSGNGSDWGSGGVISSPSAVTVRWDNTGNPQASIVYRDSRQIIPHTAGQNYLAVDPGLASDYYDYFGPSNGFGGLQVTVSQTQNLVDQTVNLSVSGVKGGTSVLGGFSKAYLEVFQCWGGLNADGKPDANAAEPDPATCQVGANGPDTKGGSYSAEQGRFIGSDLLAVKGDWAKYYGALATDVPFYGIDGGVSGSTLGLHNQYFNGATTNELSNVVIGADGTANRAFETQTSVESPGLGCGVRPNVPTTPNCWLVVVPRIAGDMNGSGPISPSIWAQRLQVRLGFRQAGSVCPGGKARTLLGGSEMLYDAAASWTPGLCGAAKIELGYSKLSDQVARTQFATGSNSAILTSQPVPSTAPADQIPLALTAPVFAYSYTYQPTCVQDVPPPSSDSEARNCGYANLAALQQDWKRAGTPVRDLRLNARLVAKLLTQSYAQALIHMSGMPTASWMASEPTALATDPEFLALNPGLVHEAIAVGAPALKLDHLIIEVIRSDAAAEVWQWILGDPDARAYLNGCPDRWGDVINPFYSTRTYVGCEARKSELSAVADAARAGTAVSPSYVDQPLMYPSLGTPYPEPTWQQYQAAGTTELPLTVIDWLPTVNSMSDAGRDSAIGYVPQNNNWCDPRLDITCGPLPGKWSDLKVRQPSGSMGLMAVTDAATAARFQLATAQLCDDSGQHCVGANSGSLDKAGSEFTTAGVGGLPQPAQTPDYVGGAYPLTMPVYAAIAPSLDLTDRQSYATALHYIVTTGQNQGFAVGDLPPGYAPLPPSLLSLANRTITTLRTAPTAPKPPHTPVTSSATPGGTTPTGPTLTPATPHGSKPTTAPTTQSTTQVALLPVAASHETWAWYTMPLGIVITLMAGLAGPIMRLGFGVRLR